MGKCEGFLKYLYRCQDKCAVSKKSTYLGTKPECPQLNLLHRYHKYCGAIRGRPIKDTSRNNIQLGFAVEALADMIHFISVSHRKSKP